MSAYMVDRNHINYLVSAAVNSNNFSYWDESRQERVDVNRANASEVGQMLWNENHYSVATRYNSLDEGLDKLPGVIGEDYQFEYVDCVFLSIRPVELLKACHCFEYQSCEHDGWEDSLAYNFIDTLAKHYMRRLAGYEAAEWGAPEPQHEVGAVVRLIG